jgi:protein-disulfide isomerase
MSHPFELAVPVGAADHVLGGEHAPVTIVEYGDFECPNCRQAAPAVKLILEHFRGRVRLVWRHFPLEGVHPHALSAALAAEAAGAQGRFWPMHDLLLENQAHLKTNHLSGYARRLELDPARFEADVEEHVYLQRVREQIEGGEKSGARGTPSFFVNGSIQDVSFGLQALRDRVGKLIDRPG